MWPKLVFFKGTTLLKHRNLRIVTEVNFLAGRAEENSVIACACGAGG